LNEELKFFEVDFQQGNFKILWLLPYILILLFFEKLIFPIMSKTEDFGQTNARNFRGLSLRQLKPQGFVKELLKKFTNMEQRTILRISLIMRAEAFKI
jgi:hypothetical protein